MVDADAVALEAADLVVLVAPANPATAPPAIATAHVRDVERIRPWVEKGTLWEVREFLVEDLDVRLRLYRRLDGGR